MEKMIWKRSVSQVIPLNYINDMEESSMDIDICPGQDTAVLKNKRETINGEMTSTRIDIGSKAEAKKTKKDWADIWVKGALDMMERDNISKFEQWDDSEFLVAS